MKSAFVPFLILASLPLTTACRSTAPPPSAGGVALTLDALHSPPAFRPERFGPARWLEDGTGYTTLEDSVEEAGGRDIVRYDPASGEREILVPAARLIPGEGGLEPLQIADYSWSMNRGKLLIFTNTRRVWRYHTRGDYWVLDLANGELQQLGREREPATMMFAKFSPDATRVAYVSANDLWVEELATRETTRLTDDGSETIINGTFDWVYEEEFSARDGFRWSPDGERIAYWQLDAEGVGVYNLIDFTAGLYSEVIPVQYPKVGTTNSACRVGVIASDGGTTRWLEVEGDPRNNYIARMEWAASSDELVLQQLNRLQNENRVLLGDARTGEVRRILTERDEAWTDVVDDLRWFDDGARFTWVSEREGWRHVYLVSRDGNEVTAVSPAPHDLISIVDIDEEGGWLHYIAAPENATQRYLYRISLDGAGEPERLTPVDQPGTHEYQLSPGARWAIHTYSAVGQPPVIDLVELPEHRRVQLLVDNATLRERHDQLARGTFEFFRVEVEPGVELDGWCMKPPGFDPERQRYPLLVYVYGEPAGTTVGDRWGGDYYLWHLMLTQLGYVVISVDNRGTRVPRGREFRKSIYGQIGILASLDQAAALRRLLERWPWIDGERVGIWGWSGGGSMSLNMILRYPELYSTAMAIAPVPNQRYYDTAYQERYMGLPDQNAHGFEQGSPVTFADRLEGNLLLIHGTGDDNCHYQGTEELIDALIAAGKHFTMMAYPNRGHGIYEGEGTRRHLYQLLTRYLLENLPPGPVAE
jgi:dipeptidyl-peptidase 4